MSEAQKKAFPSSESDADSPEEEVCNSEDGSHSSVDAVCSSWTDIQSSVADIS
jgi:hypothetical protein